jgi:hypothetical protein
LKSSDKNALIVIAITCGLAFVAYAYVRDFGITTAAGWALHRDATSMFTPPTFDGYGGDDSRAIAA